MALCLVFGSDTIKSHDKFNKIVAQTLKKETGFSFFKVDEESFSEDFFNRLFKTKSLFSGKSLIAAKRLFSNQFASDFLIKNLKKISLSENVFILWEEKITEDHLKSVKEYANDLWEFKQVAPKKERFFKNNNLFQLADLVASRQKEKAWLLYQEELFNGTQAEDIFWKMIWQIKSLLIVKKGGGSELLHPFVYKKAEKTAPLFSKEELHNCFSELIDLYHKDRRGAGDLAVGLERFILKI
jgi:DNA polymerase III delta subunit